MAGTSNRVDPRLERRRGDQVPPAVNEMRRYKQNRCVTTDASTTVRFEYLQVPKCPDQVAMQRTYAGHDELTDNSESVRDAGKEGLSRVCMKVALQTVDKTH